MKPPFAQLLQQAITAHQEGKLQDAESLYRSILQTQPDHAGVNHNLGLLAVSAGKVEEALPLFENAYNANPNLQQFWLSYIDALIMAKQSEKAKQVLDKARIEGIAEEKLSDLEHRLAAIAVTRNSTSERITEKETTIKNANTNVPPQQQLVSLLEHYQNGRLKDAETLATSMSQQFPGHEFSWKILGAVFSATGRHSQAVHANQVAVALSPQDADAHNNLGAALIDIGEFNQAEASYRQALTLVPDHAVAHNNLGSTLIHLGRLEEAVKSCTNAIKLKPDYAEAHDNLGSTLLRMGNVDQAVESFTEAVTLTPDDAIVHTNLGTAFRQLGRVDQAEARYRHAIALKPDYAEAHSKLLFLNSSMRFDENINRKDLQRFADLVSEQVTSPYSTGRASKTRNKLRVGFVSGDFKLHPVAFFLEGLLAQLQSSSIEPYAYTTDNPVGSVTERLKILFHKWRPLSGKTDRESAQAIHSDGIDILIDLSGHTIDNRLAIFGWKPAPIQVTWLGYFASTGLPEIDYILGDPFVTPLSEAHHFTEEIWQLPESYLCFTPPDQDAEIGSLPALKNGYLTFGCFNSLMKMTDEVVSVRAEILDRVPDSKLFLKDEQLDHQSSRDRVISRFAAHGIRADRLLLEGRSSRAEYLECYNRVDIALSPFPYGGGTTSVESLWMGVPVITRRGSYFLSHLGESIAHNSKMSDWIAQDNEDYVGKAMRFSSDLNSLGELRHSLREKLLRTPLYDLPRFANHFEEALWKMRESVTF